MMGMKKKSAHTARERRNTMDKMWAGRFNKALNEVADDFNSSIRFDQRMVFEDIRGSMAHATMLQAQGILPPEDVDAIHRGLTSIRDDLQSGKLAIDEKAEDVHMFVEGELTARIGAAGKRLHTARSRNDQVALDIRLYLREEIEEITSLLRALIAAVTAQAEKNTDAIMPGYTHLQRAQPIVFAHQLLAYAMMFKRDLSRLADCKKRMNLSPLGACALAGTTYPTDRALAASLLDFDGITANSIDSVSDRDFCLELLSDLSIVMMHLSRFSEEIILWASWEFKFIELDDSFTTGSSIMPQKKNADMAELVRGKTGRVYGDLMGSLTMLKGLPLAYNKDMQEDKESVFDAVDTVKACLSVFTPMIETMTALKDNMLRAAKKGFINATDLADYLTKKGMPFRTAYKTVGTIVGACVEGDRVLEDLSLDEYRSYSTLFEADLFDEISLQTCVEKRISAGSTGPGSVAAQIAALKAFLAQDGANI